MKKAGFAVLIFFAASLIVSAEEPVRTLSFGLKAGYNSGQLRAVGEGNDDFEVDKFAVGGFSLGGFVRYRLSRILALQGELHYFAKGGGYEVTVPVPIPGISIRVKDERRLTYIEIPVTLKFSLPVDWRLVPTFYGGLSLGINLSGTLESRTHIETPVFPIDLDETKDLKDELNDMELSGVLGGGLDIKMGRATLHLDNRFFFGLKTNVFQIVVPMSKFAAIGFPAGPDAVYELKMLNYVSTFTIGVSY